MKKIATRQSYGEALAELGRENPNVVVLDADLSGATKTSIFAKEFPKRFAKIKQMVQVWSKMLNKRKQTMHI